MDNQQNNYENPVQQTVVLSQPVQPVQQVVQPQRPVTPKVKNKGLSTGKIVLLFLITVVISVFIGAGSVLAVLKMYPDLTQEKVTNVTRLEKEISITDEGIADAVDKIYNSVVIVKTYRNGKLYATGTGFVYKKENGTYYLLTNYHVIQDGEKVEIVFTDNKVASVNVQGGDKYSDIAVLTYRTDDILDIATMGSSVDMRVGDTVFAIGSPLDSNVYSWSVTRGVLSGKDREVEVSTNNTTANDWIMQVLQTDAAINSGNSGGPLCNSNGEVIGVNNMKLINDGVEGMGFAIPIEEAGAYADAIINGEDVSRPKLGVVLQETQSGLTITSVEAGSSASAAGLKVGDIITAIDKEKLYTLPSLKYKLYKYKVGETITVHYTRNGKSYTTKLKLTA